MKKTIALLLLVFAFTTTQSQTLDTAALKSYPASVIIRVNDVAIKVSLTSLEQVSIADLFQDEETDLATLALNGATPRIIDSVKAYYKSSFNQLLPSQKITDYYNACNASKVKTTARLMAIMLKNKYNSDATMQQYFKTIYGWREELVERIWCKNVDTTNRNNNLYDTYYTYDSLLSVYTSAAASSNFFSGKLYFLDSIASIDSLKKIALATSYYNNVIQHKNRAYADNFKDAVTVVFNQVADTPYYTALYKNEIAYNTQNATATALLGYLKRDKISTRSAQSITPILQKRERTIAILNKLYPTYTAIKDSIIDTLTVTYQNQIEAILAQDGNLHNASQIDIALRYVVELGIVPDQENNLKIALSQLNTLRATYQQANPNSEYDSKSFESHYLSTILTEEQYTQVLTKKYAAVAINMANTDWIELVRLGRTNDFVEADTKLELTNYHLAILIAYYRYASNVEIQYTTIQSINEIMPQSMRTILENWNYQRAYSDTPDTFFQW